MNAKLQKIIQKIEEDYAGRISADSMHFTDVSIAETARSLGHEDVAEEFSGAEVIVPLKEAQTGMKVMIDGRTFVRYSRFDSGLAAPDWVAQQSGLGHTAYHAPESMIRNFH